MAGEKRRKRRVMKKNAYLVVFGAVVFLFAACAGSAFACTDFQIKTTDGAVVIGRSMEFASSAKSQIRVIARGEKQAGTAPDGSDGLIWAAEYGYVAIDAFGIEGVSVDGLNEAGMAAEGLWLPGTQYQDVAAEEMGAAINVGGLCGWILGNFKTVGEVKIAIKEVRVWGSVVPELNMMPPIHFAVHDAAGRNIVIEFIEGEVNIYDNPIGVMTNAPTFDWHLTNMRNYLNLINQNADPLTIEGTTLTPTGNGSGMLGVPGDWTPPSRFVRSVLFVHYAGPVETALDGVNLAAHILNTVDIPHGDIEQKKHESPMIDYTQWIAIKDLTNRVLYVRDYKDLRLRAIDLKKLEFMPGAGTKSISLESGEYGIVDITDTLN